MKKTMNKAAVVFFTATVILIGCSKKEDSNPANSNMTISADLLNNLKISSDDAKKYHSQLQMWHDSAQHCMGNMMQIYHCDSMMCQNDHLYHHCDSMFATYYNQCMSSMMNSGGGMMNGGGMMGGNNNTMCDSSHCPQQVQQMLHCMDSLHTVHSHIHPKCN